MEKRNSYIDHLVDAHGLKHGNLLVTEPRVTIGDKVSLGHRVTLKDGTIIEDNAVLGDGVCTTGACLIGKNVQIRTGAIISKATILEDNVFIGPGVITNHTKHVSFMRPQIKPVQLITVIGWGAIIGSQCSLVAGVKICPLAVVGAGAVITKDITEQGVYFGSPAKKISDLPKEYLIADVPNNAGQQYLTNSVLSHLKAFMPNLRY